MTNRKTTREILDLIDEELLFGDRRSRDLWDVLTALRGPDFNDVSMRIKLSTTSHIRTAAFPKTADHRAAEVNTGAIFSTKARPFNVNAGDGASHHFHRHIVRAAHVLGLTDKE